MVHALQSFTSNSTSILWCSFFFKGEKIFYVQEAQADMDSGAERNIAVPAPVLHPYP